MGWISDSFPQKADSYRAKNTNTIVKPEINIHEVHGHVHASVKKLCVTNLIAEL